MLLRNEQLREDFMGREEHGEPVSGSEKPLCSWCLKGPAKVKAHQ